LWLGFDRARTKHTHRKSSASADAPPRMAPCFCFPPWIYVRSYPLFSITSLGLPDRSECVFGEEGQLQHTSMDKDMRNRTMERAEMYPKMKQNPRRANAQHTSSALWGPTKPTSTGSSSYARLTATVNTDANAYPNLQHATRTVTKSRHIVETLRLKILDYITMQHTSAGGT
jgi:hypothetical protein